MLLLFCFLYLVFVLGDFSEGGVGTALASFLSLVAFNCLAVDSSGVVFLTLILLSPLWPFLLRQQPSERSSTNSKNSALRHPSFGGRCRQAMLGVRGLAVQIYKVHVIPPHPAMFEGKADPWRALVLLTSAPRQPSLSLCLQGPFQRHNSRTRAVSRWQNGFEERGDCRRDLVTVTINYVVFLPSTSLWGICQLWSLWFIAFGGDSHRYYNYVICQLWSWW